MKVPAILLYVAAILSLVPFLRPRNRSLWSLLWPLKLFASALAPVLGLASALGALVGLARRDWKLAGAGILGTGLATRFLEDIPDPQGQFETTFGPDWQARIPASLQPHLMPRRWSLPAGRPPGVNWQHNVVYGQSATTGAPLLADLWEPQRGTPVTGLGLIYVHGGAWMLGSKDLGTQPFFRRLAGQGHVVLDVTYTLWPQGTIPGMVSEIKQAIQWLKANGQQYGVDPEHIVVMGGSAGGHLALMAAYTSGHSAFRPAMGGDDDEQSSPSGRADASVRGAVAFYPPTDLTETMGQVQAIGYENPELVDRFFLALLGWLYRAEPESTHTGCDGAPAELHEMLATIVGGEVEELPELYRLLSPMSHVGAHCPPTLLLHGTDDVFGLTPQVRRLYSELQEARVPSILVEFPHTEHAFDLVLPLVSPVAQAATYNVERFLALLI